MGCTVVLLIALALSWCGIWLLQRRATKPPRLQFASVSYAGLTIYGDITGMNLKAGKAAEFVARPIARGGLPGKIQVGSARTENSLPELFRVIQNPQNELAITVIALLPPEGVNVELPKPAVVALVADGDVNTETEALIRGEVALNWLPPDSTAFEMDGGAVRDATDEELNLTGKAGDV